MQLTENEVVYYLEPKAKPINVVGTDNHLPTMDESIMSMKQLKKGYVAVNLTNNEVMKHYPMVQKFLQKETYSML
eukprot:snap_masked-scaffold_1-processed-gene-26.50-mRNA-1 protein AED:1.00 eAED:1.00 QI:0/-1/0/0/-1/1/1/0/74